MTNSFWQLIRPGLLAAVLFSMAVTALTAEQPPPWWRLANALLGTALVITGATAMNQVIERRRDFRMARTASRPLPSGRWATWQAVVFAAFFSLAGVGYLAVLEPPIVALLAALGWGVYVLVYTPLKHLSVWHLAVGAVSGALPVLLGAATAGALCDPLPLVLAGVVFFWQFPHTATIGWMYREEYARGGAKTPSVVDPSGRLSGRLALGGAFGLLLASLAPTTLLAVGWLYFTIASAAGLAHLILATRFLGKPSDTNTRILWRMSLVHLPILLTSLLVCK
jgi:heme o synthase